ncbi:putative proton-dependent oligopeptide transporter family, MFS transporter superfamily [Helianthus annuus]|uniref:Proton-dependent oligopeptide transporter family, major facilitator superfamily n=1 Tax=Helianthus annuus TaxID=4232 RepID=A0A251RMF9_HELAN|nr:protein NRT1/ PTR FAMILY 5.4 [Helianthus annuus]KAF5754118.1 putative proton-dependent oligopeptide transporter family, major facilitator superfamily [Helianthus annuus]KAJ0432059.1 putative proton-dependent oligopeptide transporter family, MFS transporter superfamily [Helianthus annuus]KAJ0824967.1 putative proton-dependent oligopeptide transporter family, MFS transporter superfamily [Helianthus annuus]
METSVVFTKRDVTCSKKAMKGGWKSAIFIIFVEFGERFAYYGVSGNLITYLTVVLKQPLSTAAKNVNLWHGVSAIFPILGGFLADSFFGRFNTIVFSSLTYLLGLVLLVISVEAIPLNHRMLPFFVALYVINIGEGGHRPCIQTFAADQFDNSHSEEKAAKSSFFNWWYLGIVIGATTSTLIVIYVQDNVGWGWGFAIPAIVVALALGVFLFRKNTYRREDPVGSPFTKVAHVMVAAFRKRRLLPENSQGMCVNEEESGDTTIHPLTHTNQFRFLDKAAIITETDVSSGKRNHWRLCTVNQVEQVKLLLRLVPIWLSCLMFAVVIAQLSTFYTKQGSTLVRTIGSTNFQLPPASLQVLPGLTILTAVPLYERLLIPTARRLTGHPSGITMLQRIGFGILFSILTMIVSALVESKRVRIATEHGLLDNPNITVPMSVWWLVPQYVLMGISDMFTIVGLQELFYDQVPDEMRSMGAAAYLSILGVGSFMSSALISMIQGITAGHGDEWLKGDNLNRAHLDCFYWVLACLSGLSLILYVVLAKGYVYKEAQRDGEV